ncbi:MAG: GGDEF domain-containing protein [Lachnospiraceae bacterium]|nr:GGDEF domain-containing protein [Lachnospiraceae bacterium]
MNLLSTLYKGICKDTGDQNESAKLIVVVRMLTLTMIIYSFANSILFFLTSYVGGMIFSQVCMTIFLAIFVLSYYRRTFVSYCILNVCMLIWIVSNVHMFGWGIGVQTFLFVLVVFVFFAKYKHEAAKIIYVTALLAMRIYLYFYCQNNSPDIIVTPQLNAAFQIVNSVAIILSLSLLAYFFSTDTQALEGKLIEYNEQLKKQASIDPLTGLNNRRSTIEYLENLLKSAENQVSICLCDIDFFKHVNDTYGHDVGDIVLKKIAETFRKELPKDSFVSRWGGEEFLLIFPILNGDEAYIELESLRQKIKSITFESGNESFSVSLTFGLVEYDFHSELTVILKEADEKLYLGKESGRDRIIY